MGIALKIEVIEKSGEVTSPHPAGFGRARRRAQPRASALAAVAQHLLGAAAAPFLFSQRFKLVTDTFKGPHETQEPGFRPPD